mmetsp:Transcript_21330/g.84837  ORF Transcript_21330/g.84837 Transcript_21330/m.84837 type:complete len:276 (-) Transcript_21330:546-1373(-)
MYPRSPSLPSSGRPRERPAADDVEVEVEDRLAHLGAVIHYEPIRVEAGLLSDDADFGHQVAEHGDVVVLREAQLREAHALLGDEQHVDGSDGVDVLEREAVVVLVDDVGRDVAAEDLVEDRRGRVVDDAGAEDGAPAVPGRRFPLGEFGADLVADARRDGIGARDHVVPPSLELGEARQIEAPALELGQHELGEHERREHGDVGVRGLLAEHVRTDRVVVVEQTLEVGELRDEGVERRVARAKHREALAARRGFVEAALDGGEVHVVEPRDAVGS